MEIALVLAGAVVVAVVMHWLGRPAVRADTFRRDQLSTDVINMARIRVAGVGGLGLVAMAGAVAWAVPEIGRPLGLGTALGVVAGVALVLLRRRGRGPLPSSSDADRANTTLRL